MSQLDDSVDVSLLTCIGRILPYREHDFEDSLREGVFLYSTGAELVPDTPLKNIFLIDVFSIGVAAFHMLVGQQSEWGTVSPFDLDDNCYTDSTEEKTWFKERRLVWDKLQPANVPNEGLELLQGPTQADPGNRWTVDCALASSWVAEAVDMSGQILTAQETVVHTLETPQPADPGAQETFAAQGLAGSAQAVFPDRRE